jgi:hypothetical protein
VETRNWRVQEVIGPQRTAITKRNFMESAGRHQLDGTALIEPFSAYQDV